MNMHTHASHTYILHGEFLFIQLHSIRCDMVWQPLGRPVTSVVVVADGCLSCMFVCVCLFICIVFFWQRRRTALLCSNSPLSTYTNAHNSTHAHIHTHTAAAVSVTASSSSPLAQPLFSFLFAATAAVKTNSNAPVNGCVERKAIKKKLKEAKQQTEEYYKVEEEVKEEQQSVIRKSKLQLQLFLFSRRKEESGSVCVPAVSSNRLLNARCNCNNNKVKDNNNNNNNICSTL